MRQLDDAGVVVESAEFAESAKSAEVDETESSVEEIAEAAETAECAEIDSPWEETQESDSLTVEQKKTEAMVHAATEKFQS